MARVEGRESVERFLPWIPEAGSPCAFFFDYQVCVRGVFYIERVLY